MDLIPKLLKSKILQPVKILNDNQTIHKEKKKFWLLNLIATYLWKWKEKAAVKFSSE